MMSSPVRRCFPCRAALAAVLTVAGSGLLPQPARAMIIRAGGSPEADARIKAEALEAGRQLPGVAPVILCNLKTGRADFATGTYVGTDAGGRFGYLLTSAAPFYDEMGKQATGQTGVITFRTGSGETKKLRPRVTRAIVHPKFCYHILQVRGLEARLEPFCWPEQDLALLEFSLATADGTLAQNGIEPMPLYKGKEHKQPNIEARFAGAGLFSRMGDAEAEPCAGDVFAAGTRVTFGTYQGMTAFHAWTKAPGQGQDDGGAAEGKDQVEPYYAYNLRGMWPVVPHPDPACTAEGDVGCPLLITTEGVTRVAGVHGGTREDVLITNQNKPSLFIQQMYTAVADHVAWIRDVLDGKLGASRVIDLVPDPGAKDAKEGKDEGKASAGRGAAAPAAGAVETKAAGSGHA